MKYGYARVSTDDQTPALQLAALKKAGCKTVFKDEGISGATAQRPALLRCLKTLQAGDTLIVWKLDRLGRSLKHLLTLLDELRALGVQFVSYTENLDFATPAGRAMASLLGVFAEFERDLIRERVRAGMANARAKGKRPGPRSKFGTEDLCTLAQARGRGMSIRAIARHLNASPALVHKSLRKLAARAPENQGPEEAKSAVHG